MRGDLPARVALPPRRTKGPATSAAKGRVGARGAGDLDAGGRSLFEMLREWRLETSRVEGVPPYVVASDRSLRDMALLRPRDRDALLECHGIGPHKADRYGDAILAILVAARAEG